MLISERKFALMLTSLGVTLGHTVRWPECLKQQKVLKCDTVNLDVMMTETGAAAGSQQECKPASNSINTPVGSSESDFLILSRQTTNNWINRSSSVYLTSLSQSNKPGQHFSKRFWQTLIINSQSSVSFCFFIQPRQQFCHSAFQIIIKMFSCAV